MDNLISGINIKSFRGIKSFQLENLSQVNILTGDNNCGKTSVLEVLESYGQPDNFGTWYSIIRRDWRSSVRNGLTYYEGIYNLFDINSEEKMLEYTIQTKQENTNVRLTAKEMKEELSEAEYDELQGIYIPPEEREDKMNHTQLISKMELEIEIQGKQIGKQFLYEGQQRLGRSAWVLGNDYTRNVVYISPVRHAEGNIFLNQVLDSPELYEEMLAVLKEYDEGIISINYDNDDNRTTGKGVYKILSKSHQKALPLNVYGDGMKKAILLMSAVIKAKNGILLLDEFETAIHTSAMTKTFRWILETCKKLNVQVFLTSHSKEAIEKVLKCSKDLLDDIAVYTMYRDKEGTTVRRLDARKAIEVQDEMGLELR